MMNFTSTISEELFLSEPVRKYFSLADKETFELQVAGYRDFSYSQNKIIGKTILPVDDVDKLTKGYDKFWKEYEQKYGQNGFYEISFPLFSADGTKMLISVESNLFQMDSHCSLSIYRKENNKWVYWKQLLGYL